MNRIYKFIMLIVGIVIIANTTVSFLFDHKWADLINSISGLVLILFGINYSSKRRRIKKNTIFQIVENYQPINLMFF